ncbi:MAG: hypothetical protein AAGE52_36870 [Myxococcota bacterium]
MSWVALNQDQLQLTVPQVGTNPVISVVPGNYHVNVAQGFDRAHTHNLFQVLAASLPTPPPLRVVVPAAPTPASLFPIGSILNPSGPGNPMPAPPAIAGTVPVAGAGATPFHHLLRSGRLTVLQRLTTAVPYPRGLVFRPRTAAQPPRLIVLARGRPRGKGGPDPANDSAGTLYDVDPYPNRIEFAGQSPLSAEISGNGRPMAHPASPPFRLIDSTATPFTDDIETDRPYAGLVADEVGNFYVGCFSGIDIGARHQQGQLVHGALFRKNATDAVHRYDSRDATWYSLVDQPTTVPLQTRRQVPTAPGWQSVPMPNQFYPDGWLNGPDGLCVHNTTLYVVAKDNHSLVKYDIGPVFGGVTPHQPTGELVRKGSNAPNDFFDSPSAIAVTTHGNDDWIYVSFRATTKNGVYRWRLDANGMLVGNGEHVAQFPNGSQLIDMCFDSAGRLYVSAASGKARTGRRSTGAVWRLTPRGALFVGTQDNIHVALPAKCSNITVDDQDQLLVCCNEDESGSTQPWSGAIYRVLNVT